MSQEKSRRPGSAGEISFGRETDQTCVNFDRYRTLVDQTLSLQFLGITSEEEFIAVAEDETTLFAPVKIDGETDVFVPVAAKSELLKSVNTQILDGGSYIEVLPGFFESDDKNGGVPGEARVYRVGVDFFEGEQAATIFTKPSDRKELGDRDFDIFQNGHETDETSDQSLIEAYHVIVCFDRDTPQRDQAQEVLRAFSGAVIDLGGDSDPELVAEAYGVIDKIVDQESADFPITGEISEEEFGELVRDDKFFTKAYVEDGRVKSIAIVGNSLDSIEWLRSEAARSLVSRMRGDKPTYAFEPLLVVSDGEPEDGFSVPVFMASLLTLDDIGQQRGAPNSWTMFYECSPRSIFYTPRILAEGAGVGGYRVSGAIVQRTSFEPI